jgi:histidinol dehydrogenase
MKESLMNILDSKSEDFKEQFKEILDRAKLDIGEASAIVAKIIKDIQERGDEALNEHINRFDHWEVKGDLRVDEKLMQEAYESLDIELKSALKLAYERIYNYHQKQLPKSWIEFEENGSALGQKVTPVDRAGLYIPGGKAAYPSSLLMNTIPAIVAGVKEIVVTTPAPNGELNTLLLAAMHLCGIKEVYKVGGASAIAALAYGTKSIKKVDVISGPGNIFVATAKKMVFGDVNIDMIAGPSEIGIIADESANVEYLSVDMLSQAEHDEMASSILITDSAKIAKSVAKRVESDLKTLPRQMIARESIQKRGAIILTKDIDEAIYLMNEIAPEHLELMVKNPFDLLPKIKHAGAIFMGQNTPEAIGDYIAGPNHTLPTGGSAKFFSPLNVENFLKKSSIISITDNGLKEIGKYAALLAKIEGLDAHQRSIQKRLNDEE